MFRSTNSNFRSTITTDKIRLFESFVRTTQYFTWVRFNFLFGSSLVNNGKFCERSAQMSIICAWSIRLDLNFRSSPNNIRPERLFWNFLYGLIFFTEQVSNITTKRINYTLWTIIVTNWFHLLATVIRNL